MNPILILAAHTCREQLRNRSFQVAILFAGVILYMSLLLGALAAEQETRVLLDFGLGLSELLALALAVFGAATTVLKEIETKTIYLILTRPVPRFVYLLGRYCGLVLSTAAGLLAMAAVHLALLLVKGWAWQASYLLALTGILLKVAIAAALASFVALATTSVLSALTMIGIVWTLGHFAPELSFLARQSMKGPAAPILLAAAQLLPNLQLLNFRETIGTPAAPPLRAVLFGAAYAAAYSSICLALAYSWLRRKEF
ncbi:MAG: hypothetical protein HY078_01160 [Elusimicrobia bacterium]|nr:hypothetical protein [Elusimicrobiota bacterium]